MSMCAAHIRQIMGDHFVRQACPIVAVLTKQSWRCCRGGVGQAVNGVLDSKGQAAQGQDALASSSLGIHCSCLL